MNRTSYARQVARACVMRHLNTGMNFFLPNFPLKFRKFLEKKMQHAHGVGRCFLFAVSGTKWRLFSSCFEVDAFIWSVCLVFGLWPVDSCGVMLHHPAVINEGERRAKNIQSHLEHTWLLSGHLHLPRVEVIPSELGTGCSLSSWLFNILYVLLLQLLLHEW